MHDMADIEQLYSFCLDQEHEIATGQRIQSTLLPTLRSEIAKRISSAISDLSGMNVRPRVEMAYSQNQLGMNEIYISQVSFTIDKKQASYIDKEAKPSGFRLVNRVDIIYEVASLVDIINYTLSEFYKSYENTGIPFIDQFFYIHLDLYYSSYRDSMGFVRDCSHSDLVSSFESRKKKFISARDQMTHSIEDGIAEILGKYVCLPILIHIEAEYPLAFCYECSYAELPPTNIFAININGIRYKKDDLLTMCCIGIPIDCIETIQCFLANVSSIIDTFLRRKFRNTGDKWK